MPQLLALLPGMPSRDRLMRLGAAAEKLMTTRVARVLARILLLAGLVFVALRARSLWRGSQIDFERVDWGMLAGAFALAVAGTAAAAAIWLAILEALGARTRWRWITLFFQSQLGKYIPGSVWQYAGRASAAHAHGVPVKPVGVSLPVEFTASGLAAGSMAAFFLGWWGGACVGAGALLVLACARRAGSGRPVVRAAVRATLLYLPVWLVFGASFWLVAHGLVQVSPADLGFYTGAFAVAWLAGLLAVYAPGGLGVREAVLVALLSSRIGAADALVVAAGSRLSMLLADVVLAALATVAVRPGPPRLDLVDSA